MPQPVIGVTYVVLQSNFGLCKDLNLSREKIMDWFNAACRSLICHLLANISIKKLAEAYLENNALKQAQRGFKIG